jgi:hypothetical protein
MTSASRRALLSDRLRAAAEEAGEVGARLRVAGPPSSQRPDDDAYLSRIGEPLGDEGEVFGAGTGRARRAIERDDVRDILWDPQRAYPQITTRSTDHERPRTIAAGYDPKSAILRVTFRGGVTYEYLGVPPRQWTGFQKAPSPGRYIDDVLEQYPYRPLQED